VDTAEPTSIERPDPNVLLVWRLSNLLAYAVFTAITLVILTIVVLVAKRSPSLFLLALIPIGLWLFSGLVLRKQWENWTFRITPESLEMAQGWIWKQRRIVARDRIQHVDINSGPFDRKFGLVQVVVHTAGTTVGMIPGLRPERAEQLREDLMAGRGGQ
jgi:uncharacterized protein